VLPPGTQQTRLHPGETLQRNFRREDRLPETEERQRCWQPIKIRSDERCHDHHAKELGRHPSERRSREHGTPPIESLGDRLPLRDDHSPGAGCHVLAASEAEDADVALRAEILAIDSDAHRLSRVFHEEDATRMAQGAQPFDVRGHTKKMVRDDAQRVVGERRRELRVIEVERRRLDVTEHWAQPGRQDSGGHRVARERRNNHVCPLRQIPQRNQRHRQRGCS
jgi:hypothetical protein